MKQPTADDVMAAVEVARVARDVMIVADTELPKAMRNLERAVHVMDLWLDQFDDFAEGA